MNRITKLLFFLSILHIGLFGFHSNARLEGRITKNDLLLTGQMTAQIGVLNQKLMTQILQIMEIDNLALSFMKKQVTSTYAKNKRKEIEVLTRFALSEIGKKVTTLKVPPIKSKLLLDRSQMILNFARETTAATQESLRETLYLFDQIISSKVTSPEKVIASRLYKQIALLRSENQFLGMVNKSQQKDHPQRFLQATVMEGNEVTILLYQVFIGNLENKEGSNLDLFNKANNKIRNAKKLITQGNEKTEYFLSKFGYQKPSKLKTILLRGYRTYRDSFRIEKLIVSSLERVVNDPETLLNEQGISGVFEVLSNKRMEFQQQRNFLLSNLSF